MATGAEAEWEAFATSAWPGLVRTATLLQGTPAGAEELAATALLRTRRQVRNSGDGDHPADWSRRARTALLTQRPALAAGLRRRVHVHALGHGDADPLLRRYRDLRQRQRALLVLTAADGLDVADAAHLLGLPLGRAAGELAGALDDLRGAGAEGAAGSSVELDLGALGPGADPAEDADSLLVRDAVVREVADAFARLGVGVVNPRGGPGRAEQAMAAARRSRRRTAVLAAGVAVAVVATTTGVAGQSARAEAERQRVQRERAAYAALHPTVLNGDVTTWPPRGSRATDARLLADVAARVGGRSAVLFAGDVRGVDVVVALNGRADLPLLHVLAGSAGSPVDSWREAGAQLVAGTGGVPAVTAAVPDEQGRLHLLAVTLTSGIAVSYSPAPLLADDASVSRRYLRLPLSDGVGTALLTARPDRLRMRVDGGGFGSVVAPLLVPLPGSSTGAEAPSRAPVTSTPSCERSPQLDDVPDLVGEATGEAGLAGTDITAVRVLWCRQKGREGETAIALTTRRGPDIQCYEAVEETAGGARRTGSQCWPVARGTGATAPFLAPDAAPDGSGEILALTAFAPGASTLELHVGAPDSAPLARASVAADGYARMDIRTRAATPRDYLESQAYVSLLDRRGGAVDFVEVSSRSRVDVWGEGTDGPVVP